MGLCGPLTFTGDLVAQSRSPLCCAARGGLKAGLVGERAAKPGTGAPGAPEAAPPAQGLSSRQVPELPHLHVPAAHSVLLRGSGREWGDRCRRGPGLLRDLPLVHADGPAAGGQPLVPGSVLWGAGWVRGHMRPAVRAPPSGPREPVGRRSSGLARPPPPHGCGCAEGPCLHGHGLHVWSSAGRPPRRSPLTPSCERP